VQRSRAEVTCRGPRSAARYVDVGLNPKPYHCRFEDCDILCDVGISMRLIENAHVDIDNSTLGGLPNPLVNPKP
jgi:hypothetical protein